MLADRFDIAQSSSEHLVSFISLFFGLLGLHCCSGFALVAANGCYSRVAVQGLLTAAASLMAEHGFKGMWAPYLQLSGSRAQVR